jgi:hypothetical protein
MVLIVSSRHWVFVSNNNGRGKKMKAIRRSVSVATAVAGFALVFGLATASQTATAQGFTAGIRVNDDATMVDTGINSYPGATIIARGKHGDQDSASVDLFWGGYGLKVASLKLRTSDSRESVAKFYRGDLLRFGNVLDCNDPAALAKEKQARDAERGGEFRSELSVSCKSIDAKRSSQVYRVGERNNHRIVSISNDKDGGQTIHLVHVQIRKPD